MACPGDFILLDFGSVILQREEWVVTTPGIQAYTLLHVLLGRNW